MRQDSDRDYRNPGFERNWDRNENRGTNGGGPNDRGDDQGFRSGDEQRFYTGQDDQGYASNGYGRGESRNYGHGGLDNPSWNSRSGNGSDRQNRASNRGNGRQGDDNWGRGWDGTGDGMGNQNYQRPSERGGAGWDQAGASWNDFGSGGRNGDNRQYQQEFGQSSYFGGVRQGGWNREAMNRSDSDIEDGIHDAFDDERGIPHDMHIDVRVENKVVTLTGNAPNRYIKELAGRCAWNEPGVRDVHNNLSIQPGRRERAWQSRSGSNLTSNAVGADNTPVSADTHGTAANVDSGTSMESNPETADSRNRAELR